MSVLCEQSIIQEVAKGHEVFEACCRHAGVLCRALLLFLECLLVEITSLQRTLARLIRLAEGMNLCV